MPDRLGSLVDRLVILIYEDNQREHLRGEFPGALSSLGEQRGAGLQDGDRVGKQDTSLLRG
jgi:hypothetical protein